MGKFIKTGIIGFLAGIAGAYTFNLFMAPADADQVIPNQAFTQVAYDSPAVSSELPEINHPDSQSELSDFSMAANKAIPSVVYINSIFKGASYSMFDWFFGGGAATQTRVSSGSGVIFTRDGYIVTNNHVIEAAEKIEVMYNKKVYPAELIGTDPSTDLAVLKINESNLPAITLGSSKNLQVGEWVVAVGNPFSLSSTVTSGIVSAKGRRIGILEGKFPIESFIQTDAAINPGNSGGALVNKSGDLVGINTAILSRTGSYTGYAFAVPVDIAKKVFDDLVKYGIIQKALFGGNVIEYNFQNAQKYKLDTDIDNFKGVLIESLEKEGPAFKAGLKPGDVIIRINNTEV
nr:trypsin-like peptidase domain-containing protein [Cyclobacteriaceae bacterium]